MNSSEQKFKQYEKESTVYLKRKEAVIVRADMRKSKNILRLLHKPFDDVFTRSIQYATIQLCEQAQGCIIGYTANDEISIIMFDESDKSGVWFDWNIQKLVSNVASIITNEFNKKLIELSPEEDCYKKAIKIGATFDARCFNIKKVEIQEYLSYRQEKAINNSIQTLARTHFNHKELQNKSCEELKSMLLSKKGINWDELNPDYKYGVYCIKQPILVDDIERHQWKLINKR